MISPELRNWAEAQMTKALPGDTNSEDAAATLREPSDDWRFQEVVVVMLRSQGLVVEEARC
jgi:hypothetical protein